MNLPAGSVVSASRSRRAGQGSFPRHADNFQLTQTKAHLVVRLEFEMPVSEHGAAPVASLGTPRASKLSETIAKQIADDIFDQGLQPGTKLSPEREMIERFGISRGTLREALRILEVHGLLVIRSGPHGGPAVAQMTAADFNKACSLHFKAAGITVQQLWEARVGLEPTLARLATENLNDDSRAELSALLESAEQTSVRELAQYIRMGSAVHRAIATASRNPILSLFSRSLGEMTANMESSRVFAPSEHERVHADHLTILRTILAGKAKRAESLVTAHMIDMRDTHMQRYPGLVDNVLPYLI
jgi:GntR family transcriptional regulator, transcriptional repressor for pyruvate dehydrogenase complex